jgi:hypothetical protein
MMFSQTDLSTNQEHALVLTNGDQWVDVDYVVVTAGDDRTAYVLL